MSAYGPGRAGWSVMSDLRWNVGDGSSCGTDAHERLDRATLVHRRVRIRDVVEISLVVKDETRIDPAHEHVFEEFRDVGTNRGRTALDANVAEEQAGDLDLDPMWDADVADGGARSRDL